MPSYIEGAGEIMNFDINTMMNLMSMMKSFGNVTPSGNADNFGSFASKNRGNNSQEKQNYGNDFLGENNQNKNFGSNSEQENDYPSNNPKRNFDLTTLAKLLPLFIGNQGGNDGLGNLLGMISAMSSIRNTPSQKQENADFRTKSNENEESTKVNSHVEKPRNIYDKISFAGDEVVYFLRKMRILSTKITP